MGTTTECRYRPGQIWDYKTRPFEPLSTLTILKVWTPYEDYVVVHIAIEDLLFTRTNGEVIDVTLTHTVITPEALDQSVTELVGESSPIPDFSMEYASWERESGAAFERTVADVVTTLEEAWRYGVRVEPEQ